LVHEAYLRLVDKPKARCWESKWQFYAAAAEAMRRILLDNARSRGRQKRGGGQHRIDLEKVELTVFEPPEELIALNDALEKLGEKHPEKARLVTLRYFAGLTQQEVAEAMKISISTADRHWAFARAWLYRQLGSEEHSENGESSEA
jgi:RNA polymerase sigma factor (TIGR02999 family)